MYKHDEERKAKAEAMMPVVMQELTKELASRGINGLKFEECGWGNNLHSHISAQSYEKVKIECARNRDTWTNTYTGDVCIVVDAAHGFTRPQTFRRRKDGTFNWEKIADKIKATQEAIEARNKSRQRSEELRQIENQNRQAIADLDVDVRRDINATNKPDQYDFKPVFYGLSLAQAVGLVEHIKEWQEANGRAAS